MNNSISQEYAKAYMLAGKATVGIHSITSGKTFWFYIKKKDKNTWFVYLGYRFPETYENKYIGHITDDEFKTPIDGVSDAYSETKKEWLKVFEYTWLRIIKQAVPSKLIILHEGHCSYCGKTLSDPTSLIIGIGPTCRKKLGL